MQMPKPDPDIEAWADHTMTRYTCDKKKMFGSPVYFINGNMMAGVHGDGFFFRLSADDRSELMAAVDEVSVFEPMEGRVMKDYVMLAEPLLGREGLAAWLGRSYEYVSSLPPKTPKKKSKGAK